MINSPNINPLLNYNTGIVPDKEKQVSDKPEHIYQKTSPYTKNIYLENTISVYNPPKTQSETSNITHTSWFYVNDVHGKMTNMERIYNMSQEFDATKSSDVTSNFWTNSEGGISKFKVASGDIILGANHTHNEVANKFLNWSGFIASALGNHELDVVEPGDLAKLLSDSKYKMLAANIEIEPNSPLNGRIEKSMVIEKDGQKYGLIGIAPSDMMERVKMNDTLKDIHVKDVDSTIKIVQDEVDNLKKQGINKIIVLSHSGNKNDIKLAKETSGIDIIFGAHTHDLIEGIQEGKNLIYSKSGEPTVITQAGKDGENVGILNVDFNENGIITKAQNNIIRTRAYNRPLYVKDSVENIIGKPEIIGKVKSSVAPPQNRLVADNPHGDLIADAMRTELGTDIALLNSGNIRGSFSQGPIDTRLVSDITPFEDKMLMLNLSEKQIVDSIKVGCKSLTTANHKPGILLVSGLKYKCNKNGELLSLEFIDKNNQAHEIDVNNPDANKKYTVAADDFFATGGDSYLESNKNPDFILQKFDMDKNKLACDYIKKLEQPMEIKADDRIQIVD